LEIVQLFSAKEKKRLFSNGKCFVYLQKFERSYNFPNDFSAQNTTYAQGNKIALMLQ